MNYFIAVNLGPSVSGIESAQLKRLKLFQEQKLLATCVYTQFNPQLYKHAKRFTIEKDYLSMYDYFQQSVGYAEKSIDWLSYWEKELELTLTPLDDRAAIRLSSKQGTILMYAYFENTEYKQLTYINYVGETHILKREQYDCRGFLSKVSYYTSAKTVYLEMFYTPDGRPVIEKHYEEMDNKVTLTKLILLDHEERTHVFPDEKMLQCFFFNDLYQIGDVYICDRNKQLSEMLLKINPAIPLCAVFHSVHMVDTDDPMDSAITSPYKKVLENTERYERIIVSTDQQRVELEERFPELKTIRTIPVGYSEGKTIPQKTKQKGRLIGVARYSAEKQILHQLELMARLKEDYPNVTLHLYGFGGERKELAKQIQEKKLETTVFLEGFMPDLTEAYKASVLSLLTSRVEGFSLALLEAQSHGVPTISYDVRYGPKEIIEDGITGYLVEQNNQEELYQKVKHFLDNPVIQEAFSENSVILSERYSKDIVGARWKVLLQDIDNNHKKIDKQQVGVIRD